MRVQVVQLAAHAYCSPCLDPTLELQAQFEAICTLRHAASLLLTNILQPEVWQYEASASEPGSLLRKAADLAACPLLHSCQEINEGSVLVLAYHVASTLAHSLKQQRGSQAGAAQNALQQRVMRHLGGSILPALCQSAAHIAAAGPGPGSVGGPGAAATAAAEAAAAAAGGATQADGSLGELCWGDLSTEWTHMLRSWSGTAIALQGVQLRQLLTSSAQRAAAAAAVQALLRLAPLLPQQPVEDVGSGGGLSERPTTAAAAVVAAGGARAVLAHVDQARQIAGASVPVPVLLSANLPPLAMCLLGASAQGDATEAAATEAFSTFSTVCRYVHLLGAAVASAGSAAAAGALGCPPPPLLFYNPASCHDQGRGLLIAGITTVVRAHLIADEAAGDGPGEAKALLEAAQR